MDGGRRKYPGGGLRQTPTPTPGVGVVRITAADRFPPLQHFRSVGGPPAKGGNQRAFRTRTIRVGHARAGRTAGSGRGAILAHSMGLGKTLQIIAFLHTVLSHESLPFRTALVLGPKNTLYNWAEEFRKWGADEDIDVHVIDPAVHKRVAERVGVVQRWHDDGGADADSDTDTDSDTEGGRKRRRRRRGRRPAVLLLSYDQFKLLAGGRPSSGQRRTLRRGLLDPGPDLAVLDEGHVIANPKTAINATVSRLRTRRRLILTGTPLSNNLSEYHAMVTFVRPGLLGSPSEFRSRFVVPIESGRYSDADPRSVRLMKRRVHVLNRTLRPVMHRRGAEVLAESLPPKFEYVVSVRLNDVQRTLYREFLERRGRGREEGSFLHAWHSLQRIWNHPRAIGRAEEIRRDAERRETLRREMDDFIDDGSIKEEGSWSEGDDDDDDEDNNEEEAEEKEQEGDGGAEPTTASNGRASSSGARRRAGAGAGAAASASDESDRNAEEEEGKPGGEDDETRWWEGPLGGGGGSAARPDDLASESGKLRVLHDILSNLPGGDKVAIFSQSVVILELVEEWLERSGGEFFGQSRRRGDGDGDEEEEDDDGAVLCRGLDFLRIDGTTSSERRQRYCDKINDAEDPARVILISVKAGSLGINLVGANRVVLFDTSFNPTHDVQAIFRAYRYGQTRPVSVYRLVASGTMEERIYRRQVEKRALFSRVVDEHQIERHFPRAEVEEMVRLLDDEDQEEEEARRSKIKYKSHADAPPSDPLFARILRDDGGRRFPQYHEHDSLLENRPEEELTEEEKRAAWEEFERADRAAAEVPPAAAAAVRAAPPSALPAAHGIFAGTMPYDPNLLRGQRAYQIAHPAPGISTSISSLNQTLRIAAAAAAAGGGSRVNPPTHGISTGVSSLNQTLLYARRANHMSQTYAASSATRAILSAPGMPGGTLPYNPAVLYGQQPYHVPQPGIARGYGAYGAGVNGIRGGSSGRGNVPAPGAADGENGPAPTYNM